MKRETFIYGLVGGLLTSLLKWIEYRYLVVEYSLEVYGGLVAVLFAGLGMWLGRRITRSHSASEFKAEPAPTPLRPEVSVRSPSPGADVTARELEILRLIAAGLSNREIAAKLYVSENTVKTHASRIFDKLGARRRTQAVQLGKEAGLLH